MPRTSGKRKQKQAAMAAARHSRWASPDCDKENVDPSRVTTRKAHAAHLSNREQSRAVLRERVRDLEATVQQIGGQLSDTREMLDSAKKRAAQNAQRADSSARLARKWLARARSWHSRILALSPLPDALKAVTEDRNRYRRENKALKMRLSRATGIQKREVQKAITTAMKERRTLRLKERGRVPRNVRRMFRKLVASAGVPAAKANLVVKIVAEACDVDVEGTVSRKTIATAVIEGGVAADLQIVDALRDGKGAGLGMDGTTHKHRNYTAVHLYVVPPDGSPARKFFSGIFGSVNHTSETQFSLVQKFFERIVSVWNSSPLGSHMAVALIEIINVLRAMNTDHAEDQQKLVRLIQAWIHDARMELLGQKDLLQMPPLDLCVLVAEETGRMIDDIGGPVAFAMLDSETQAEHHRALYASLCRRYGQTAFDKLSAAEQRMVDFFVWAGCCMHKDLNAVKGGNKRMQEYWATAGVAPVQLMNADNAAAVALDPSSSAAARAREVSGFGGVKLMTLVGMVLRNKYDKLGQQESTGVFFEFNLDEFLTFPDTSNTRFQCFCTAAAKVITRLDTFKLFMQHIRAKKDSGTFTNIEKNIVRGLDDPLTITELLVLAFYNEIFSHPYMKIVRAPGQNAIDLGPLHRRIIAHCDAILADPEIILSRDDDAWKRATLDGHPWTNPDVVYRIHQLSASLPHFKGALLAFVGGVRETFERFSAEFVEGGVINTMTEAERAAVFLPATNDWNEGELGSTRLSFRKFGRLSLLRHNSATMFDRNGTDEYMETLSDDILRWITAEARRRQSAGLEKKMRTEQAIYDTQKAEENEKERREKAERAAEREAAIDAVVPICDENELTSRRWKKDDLNAQLDWFRRSHTRVKTGHSVPLKSHLKTNADRQQALAAAVTAWNTRTTAASPAPQVPDIAPVGRPDLMELDMGEEELLRE